MTAATRKTCGKEDPRYRDNDDHIRDELRKLDLLIRRRVVLLRMLHEAMPETATSHPMYVSHSEVDWLLTRRDPDASRHPELEGIDRELELLQRRIDDGILDCRERGVFLALPALAQIFGLSTFEIQTIAICLAPELERRYDRLYAYLQDDITRKKPSVDLVLDLLCRTGSDRWRARTLFSGATSLFRAGILHKRDDAGSPSGSSGLSRFLELDQRILCFILGDGSLDARLPDFVRLTRPLLGMNDVLADPSIKTPLLHFVQELFSERNPGRKTVVFHFHGPAGVGRRELALGVCGEFQCPMLTLDMELLPSDNGSKEEIMRAAFREGLLHQAAVFIANIDAATTEDEKGRTFRKKLSRMVEEFGWLTFLAGERPWPYDDVFQGTVFRDIELPMPEPSVRRAAWESALKEFSGNPDESWAHHLASRFCLTPGRIREAVAVACFPDAEGKRSREVTLSDLFRACRIRSNRRLAEMALKIEPRYDWDDLVLPENQIAQLREICCQVRHNCLVFGDWGFGRKLSRGKGLSVLFSGPSGTGKTMGAEVIAHELGLDLYKIDLSMVVSKYIGETEKNLSRVFQEAETSNAVLFFDEADALFGKRTEVSDAHDRYANVETGYLLQRMEEYEGVVILATNLRDNMDEAFIRRIRFVVEFPFPDEASRSKIWRKHFPEETPVSDLVDFDLLAKRYGIAGGNIRNIVLNAAFLAAEDGGVIGMDHLLHGTRREFEKIGKVWTDDMFRNTAATSNGGKG